jgi:signal transduction histidine kinase
VIPETVLTGTTGERRRAPQDAPGAARVWDPNGPTGGSIAPGLWDALRDSVLWAESEWERVMQHASGREEANSHLVHLCAVIRQEAAGLTADTAAIPRNALSRLWLSLIRTAFVQRSAALPVVDSGQLLQILNAIERVGQHLEAEWSQHFADRLSAPDGLELVVEVAHDLRSPLTSILFLAETLQRGRSGAVNTVQERQLGLIYSAAFGLSSVASDVIELARGGDRLVDLDPIPFSVTDILESVRDIVQPIAEEKNLTIRLTVPESDFRIGHPVALSRVLLNLTTNALKFTGEGFVELTAIQRAPRSIEFSVRDTGRGIPPQSMATLFEPFRRRQKPGEYAFSGSGLGLSICRKLVEAMGSVMQVETAPGYGTRFYFVLDLPLAGEGQFG